MCANFTSDNFQHLVTLILSEGTNDPEIIEDAVPIALLCPIFPSPQLELLLVHPMNVRKVRERLKCGVAWCLCIRSGVLCCCLIVVLEKGHCITKHCVGPILRGISQVGE